MGDTSARAKHGEARRLNASCCPAINARGSAAATPRTVGLFSPHNTGSDSAALPNYNPAANAAYLNPQLSVNTGQAYSYLDRMYHHSPAGGGLPHHTGPGPPITSDQTYRHPNFTGSYWPQTPPDGFGRYNPLAISTGTGYYPFYYPGYGASPSSSSISHQNPCYLYSRYESLLSPSNVVKPSIGHKLQEQIIKDVDMNTSHDAAANSKKCSPALPKQTSSMMSPAHNSTIISPSSSLKSRGYKDAAIDSKTGDPSRYKIDHSNIKDEKQTIVVPPTQQKCLKSSHKKSSAFTSVMALAVSSKKSSSFHHESKHKTCQDRYKQALCASSKAENMSRMWSAAHSEPSTSTEPKVQHKHIAQSSCTSNKDSANKNSKQIDKQGSNGESVLTPAVSSSANIPVGIAVARQRHDPSAFKKLDKNDKSTIGCSAARSALHLSEQKPSGSISCTGSSMPPTVPHCATDSSEWMSRSEDIPKRIASRWMSSPAEVLRNQMAWPSAYGHAPLPVSLTSLNDPAHMPIPPVGYQLTRDPISGHVFLIPTLDIMDRSHSWSHYANSSSANCQFLSSMQQHYERILEQAPQIQPMAISQVRKEQKLNVHTSSSTNIIPEEPSLNSSQTHHSVHSTSQITEETPDVAQSPSKPSSNDVPDRSVITDPMSYKAICNLLNELVEQADELISKQVEMEQPTSAQKEDDLQTPTLQVAEFNSGDLIPAESQPVADFIDNHGLNLLLDSIEEFTSSEEMPKLEAQGAISPRRNPTDDELSIPPLSSPEGRFMDMNPVEPINAGGLGLLCALAEQRFNEEIQNRRRVNCCKSSSEDESNKVNMVMPQLNRPIKQEVHHHPVSKLPAPPIGSPICGYSSAGSCSVDNMEPMEIEMRLRMAELQRKYKEKQRQLAKLQPKKEKSIHRRNCDLMRRRPGRPKKRLSTKKQPSASCTVPKQLKEIKKEPVDCCHTTDDEILNTLKHDSSSDDNLPLNNFAAAAAAAAAATVVVPSIKKEIICDAPYQQMQTLKTNDDQNVWASKKRKPGRPRKHLTNKSQCSTETIVAKKLKPPSPNKQSHPPIFYDEDAWKRRRSERIFLNEIHQNVESTSCNLFQSNERKRKSIKPMIKPIIKRAKLSLKKAKNIQLKDRQTNYKADDDAKMCIITAQTLKDELRVLVLVDGFFYAARINAIEPPDVYGVIIDGERGNRSHIYTQEEILKDAIIEKRPQSLENLKPGTRVCAYWSQQYRCLYPGTIAKASTPLPFPERSFFNVEFDDGDSGRIELEDIRFLPPDYPIVSVDPNPIMSGKKRRRASGAKSTDNEVDNGPEKEMSSEEHHHDHICTSLFHTSQKSFKKQSKQDENAQSNEAPGSFGDVTQQKSRNSSKERIKKKSKKRSDSKSRRKDSEKRKHKKHKDKCHHRHHHRHKHHHKRHRKHKRSDKHKDGVAPANQHKSNLIVRIRTNSGEQLPNSCPQILDSSDEQFIKEEYDAKVKGKNKNKDKLMRVESRSKIAAFLPAKLIWRWAGKSFKRPGVKGKARKQFYKSITRGNETIMVGDAAVFLSTGRPHLPFIGRIETMWESWGGNMVVKVKWFYHPEETKGGDKLQHTQGALFQSSHVDENDVQTISHRCQVLPWHEYQAHNKTEPSDNDDLDDVYYLAGTYDPTTQVLTFQPEISLKK